MKNKLMKLHTVAGSGSWRVSVAHCRLQELEESRPNPKLLWLDKSKSQIIQSPHPYVVHTISFTHSGFGSVLQC